MRHLDPIDRIMQTTFDMGRIFRQKMMLCDQDMITMNPLQIHALFIVEERKGLTMTELAEALHVSSPSATSLVNRLVKFGWISRGHDAKNRKLVRVQLTAEGKKFLKRKHQERHAIMMELFGFLTPEEQETLASLHEKIVQQYSQLS